MRSPWIWVRNGGVIAMAVAIALWVFSSGNTTTWITGLMLWLLGCTLVSAAALAYLQQINLRVIRSDAAPRKAKGAAA